MTTYFDQCKRSFVNVTINGDGVNTEEFLEASEGVVGMFDLLGSAAFGIVQGDLTGNIKKVRDYHNANPHKSKTLEQLVLSEKHEKKRTATQGLLWLLRYANESFGQDSITDYVIISIFCYIYTCIWHFGHVSRGLHFTLAGLQESFKNKDQGLPDSFRAGYEYTLKPHHGWAVRPVFSLAMNACPRRADFYHKLGSSREKVESELETWLDALDNIVTRMNGFYEAGGHARGL